MAQADLLRDGDSPCVHVCLMDYAAGLCIGCCRTLDEITHWANYSAAQKREVLSAVEIRRTALQSSN